MTLPICCQNWTKEDAAGKAAPRFISLAGTVSTTSLGQKLPQQMNFSRSCWSILKSLPPWLFAPWPCLATYCLLPLHIPIAVANLAELDSDPGCTARKKNTCVTCELQNQEPVTSEQFHIEKLVSFLVPGFHEFHSKVFSKQILVSKSFGVCCQSFRRFAVQVLITSPLALSQELIRERTWLCRFRYHQMSLF